MPPVRIKYYGLIWMTKSAYLITTLVVAIFAAGVMALAFLKGALPPFRWPWQPVTNPNAVGFAGLLYNHLYDLILFCLVAEGIDIVVTLRTFARKDAEQNDTVPGSE